MKPAKSKMHQFEVNLVAMVMRLTPLVTNFLVPEFKLSETRLWHKVRKGNEGRLFNYLEQNSKVYRDDKVWEHTKNTPDGFDAVFGWRSFGSPSLQLIIHDGGVENGWILEMDIDRWGPDDVRGILAHFFGEFVWHRLKHVQTNSFKIAKVLRSQGYEV